VGYEWLEIALERLRGIEPHEVNQIIAAKRRLPVPGHSADGIPVLAIWARTNTGRPLAVFIRQISRFDWLILGARDLHPDELTRFEKWEDQQL
jgi:hypothetical protein